MRSSGAEKSTTTQNPTAMARTAGVRQMNASPSRASRANEGRDLTSVSRGVGSRRVSGTTMRNVRASRPSTSRAPDTANSNPASGPVRTGPLPRPRTARPAAGSPARTAAVRPRSRCPWFAAGAGSADGLSRQQPGQRGRPPHQPEPGHYSTMIRTAAVGDWLAVFGIVEVEAASGVPFRALVAVGRDSARVLEHPGQVHQVPRHERGVAVGEVVGRAAGARIEV